MRLYTVLASFNSIRMPPTTKADEIAPTTIAHCWARGVALTRKPVFRSCDFVPPLEEATQTTAATVSAISRSSDDVQPSVKKIRHVNSSVAAVMPEIGLDEEPISPVSRNPCIRN